MQYIVFLNVSTNPLSDIRILWLEFESQQVVQLAFFFLIDGGFYRLLCPFTTVPQSLEYVSPVKSSVRPYGDNQDRFTP